MVGNHHFHPSIFFHWLALGVKKAHIITFLFQDDQPAPRNESQVPQRVRENWALERLTVTDRSEVSRGSEVRIDHMGRIKWLFQLLIHGNPGWENPGLSLLNF